MTLGITYEYYSALYPERMTEEMFDALLPSASAFVSVITASRINSAEGYKLERAKMAVCSVINEMAAQNAARGMDGARVASVSNDGYSESYGGMTDAASEEKTLRTAAFRYLSGTGLVSAL